MSLFKDTYSPTGEIRARQWVHGETNPSELCAMKTHKRVTYDIGSGYFLLWLCWDCGLEIEIPNNSWLVKIDEELIVMGDKAFKALTKGQNGT